MVDLLQQDGLLAQQVVLELGGDARVGDVGHGQQQPDGGVDPVDQFLGAEHQSARLGAGDGEIHLIGFDHDAAGQGGGQQGSQALGVPFALAQLEHRHPFRHVPVDMEGFAERVAGRDHGQVAVQQQQRRGG